MRNLGGLFVFLFACTSLDPSPDPEKAEPIFGPALPERELQGTTILGAFDTAGTSGVPYYVEAKGTLPTGKVDVSVIGGVLHFELDNIVYSGTDPIFGTMTFTGYDGKKLRITAVEPKTNDQPLRYRVLLDEADLCDGKTAVPVPGRFTVDARHEADSNAISFSCENGELYKCTRFGYVSDDDPLSRDWELNQACIYMTGARYCGDRKSFTREGTQVAMFDADGVRAIFPPLHIPIMDWTPWTLTTWPPPYNEFYVEAAWRANGRPLCLARTRWASMENDPCPGNLADPRVTTGAQYCDQIIRWDWVPTSNDIVIINTSRFNDVAFDLWQTTGGDLLGTTRGFIDESVDNPGILPPFGSNMTFVGHSGVLLRVRTAEMPIADVTLVRMYCVTGTNNCVVTTPATRPASHTQDRGPEGYLFKESREDTALLKLWKNGGDYVSAITQPAAGYIDKADLGWIYLRN